MYVSSDFPPLGLMSPISLAEMSEVSLMNRTDTKFVTNAVLLTKILDEASKAGYRVSEIDGQRLLSYKSLYYDTADLRMFTDHRNKKLVRQKVRVRTYMVSGQTYLEIKRKNNHRRTKKKRLAIPASAMSDFSQAPGASDFLESRTPWKVQDLIPETTTDFDRITLVNKEKTERITIDINLSFSNTRSGIKASLDNLVIIELKQDALKRSLFRDILLRNRIFPYRISKYCMAVSLTDPSARSGRFKEKIRHIKKITETKQS